ncbi:hypothetical protein BDB01DRAFT_894770 [Pilobolus umbonatus]|nr:hypothetical protein BDB01DRAFT_894770 [Pilobolus umbonatus]
MSIRIHKVLDASYIFHYTIEVCGGHFAWLKHSYDFWHGQRVWVLSTQIYIVSHLIPHWCESIVHSNCYRQRHIHALAYKPSKNTNEKTTHICASMANISLQ